MQPEKFFSELPLLGQTAVAYWIKELKKQKKKKKEKKQQTKSKV